MGLGSLHTVRFKFIATDYPHPTTSFYYVSKETIYFVYEYVYTSVQKQVY